MNLWCLNDRFSTKGPTWGAAAQLSALPFTTAKETVKGKKTKTVTGTGSPCNISYEQNSTQHREKTAMFLPLRPQRQSPPLLTDPGAKTALMADKCLRPDP